MSPVTGSRPLSFLGRALLWVLAALAPLALAAGADSDPSWASLTPAQQYFLAPLKPEWAGIDTQQKKKWVEVAVRFPVMDAGERLRVQRRMTDWVRMSPSQRAQARLRFQEAQQIPAQERQAKWEAYQALTPEERKKLTQRSKTPAATPVAAQSGAAGTAKRNLATVPAGVKARPATSTAVQAKPGATTTSMTTRAAPPPHHQAGMPKIAATPGFVDRTTLLPQRGPQGAAVRAPASSDPATQP